MISALIFILHLLNTSTKISLRWQKTPLRAQAMFCALHTHFWVYMKQYQGSVQISNERHHIYRYPSTPGCTLQTISRWDFCSRSQEIDALALNSSFIPQKRRGHVSALGERSLQIVWKELTYLAEFKGNTFPFLKNQSTNPSSLHLLGT